MKILFEILSFNLMNNNNRVETEKYIVLTNQLILKNLLKLYIYHK